MRGTIGGTLIFVGVVGFATVAIGVGPFVWSLFARAFYLAQIRFSIPIFVRPKSSLAVCRKLFGTNNIRIATSDGAEM